MTTKPFRPQLAVAYDDTHNLNFPLLTSEKRDGIRTLILNGQAVSRSLKPIPNKELRALLSNPLLDGLDGEVMKGSAVAEDAFNQTTRSVMTHAAGTDGLVFEVFDDFSDPLAPFRQRLESARQKVEVAQAAGLPVKFVEHHEVHDHDQLRAKLAEFLEQGWEGLMARDPNGIYKFGRSTLRSGELFKFKPWVDSEAEVFAFEPLERNTNTATVNKLGLTERSAAQSGKVVDDLLGALHVRDLVTGVVFSLGGGFTQAQREEMWADRDTLIGRVARYKSTPVGVKEAPRFPVWLGWRHPDDMGVAV